jgi:hypothetical protein
MQEWSRTKQCMTRAYKISVFYDNVFLYSWYRECPMTLLTCILIVTGVPISEGWAIPHFFSLKILQFSKVLTQTWGDFNLFCLDSMWSTISAKSSQLCGDKVSLSDSPWMSSYIMQCVSWLWTVFCWPSSDPGLTTFLESWSGGELDIASCRYGQLEIAILHGDLEQNANWVEAPRSSSKRPWSKGWNSLMEIPKLLKLYMCALHTQFFENLNSGKHCHFEYTGCQHTQVYNIKGNTGNTVDFLFLKMLNV